MANLLSFKDASPFVSCLSDEITTPPEDIIEHKLLTVFNNYHSTDVYGVLPQLNKFPPTNETMCRVPPTYNEWRKISTSSSLITPCHSNDRATLTTDAVGKQLDYGISSNRNVDEIVVLKFLRDGIESCVIVQDELNLDSKMENVLNAGDVLEDLELETDDNPLESELFDDV